MLNRIILQGRLCDHPVLRSTQNDVSFVSFSIACDRDYKSANGDRETDFINVTAWRGTADFVAKYLSKGRMVVLEGRLQIQDYTDKEGNKRKSAQVVAEHIYFGDSKKTEPAKEAQQEVRELPPRGDGDMPF